MHVAQILHSGDFAVRIGDEEADVDELLPNWESHDRIGIVSHEPFGALGASLLIQLAIAKFYESSPERRDSRGQYPPIFLFHVGGRHGDHSPLDFLPARREVFLPADPYLVLEAIRDRAITRLLVPDGAPHGLDYVAGAVNGWTDVNSAVEQTTSSFAYGWNGVVESADVVITGTSEGAEQLVRETLNPHELIDRFLQLSDDDFNSMGDGLTVPEDMRSWFSDFRRRADEVAPAARRRAEDARQPGFRQVQSFRRISVRDALGRLVP